MKRVLYLAGIIVLGTMGVCGVYLGVLALLANQTPAPALPTAPVVLYDVDAMAARMAADKDYYAKVRDEALALYAREHPKLASYDDEARMSIKLAAYYVTWGDFYGERVLLDLADIEEAAENKGLSDPVLCNLQTDGWDDTHYPNRDDRAVEVCDEMLGVAKGGSPAAFKFWGAQTAVMATLEYNDDARTLRSNSASMQKVPGLISLWEQCLAQLIKDKAPAHVICDLPMYLMKNCECDVPTLNLVIAAIDQAYNEAGADSGLRVALDGDYFTEMAWAARGTGYANTVSD